MEHWTEPGGEQRRHRSRLEQQQSHYWLASCPSPSSACARSSTSPIPTYLHVRARFCGTAPENPVITSIIKVGNLKLSWNSHTELAGVAGRASVVGDSSCWREPPTDRPGHRWGEDMSSPYLIGLGSAAMSRSSRKTRRHAASDQLSRSAGLTS